MRGSLPRDWEGLFHRQSILCDYTDFKGCIVSVCHLPRSLARDNWKKLE